MNNTWWKKLDELDADQKKFIALSSGGRYLLKGPAGSGKTNLLLLRAQYVAGTGKKNVLVLTYTNDLADFIRTGISKKGHIGADQVGTFHSWMLGHIREQLGKVPFDLSGGWNDAVRLEAAQALKAANEKLPAKKLYDAIFVDEAQDLSLAELEGLVVLSDSVTVCGDIRQSIYKQNGMSILGLEVHSLESHYRIGPEIARVADKLLISDDGSLEQSCNYNEMELGKSSAKLHDCADRDAQFATMCDLIDVQLDAYNDDWIGVLAGKSDTVKELAARFASSHLKDVVAVHDGEKGSAGFSSGRQVHVMTIHRSKGAEFRAVHMFGVEELKVYGLNSRELAYTAVTRAKTSLNAYKSGRTTRALESAFSKEAHLDLNELFDGEDSE